MRFLLSSLLLASVCCPALLTAQAPRSNPGANVNLEFAVYLWPSSADVITEKLPNSPPAETINEDGLEVTPTPEEAAAPSKAEDRKLTPEQEEKVIRFAGRDGRMVLPALGGHTTQFFSYRGAPTIEFFREKKAADGRLEKTVAGTFDFAPTAKKVLLILRSSDMNQTFQVEGVEVTDELLPKGRLLFVNGTEKAFEIEVAGVKNEIQPRLSVKGSLESLKDFKLPCKLSVKVGEGPSAGFKKVMSTNLYFASQDLRLVYFIHEVKETSRIDLIAIDPFQTVVK